MAGVAVAVAGAYVCLHKPAVVNNSCWRSTHRADGRPKKSFDSAARANLQSLIQLLRHGEICNSYKVGDKYYTGHSNKTPIKSVKDLVVPGSLAVASVAVEAVSRDSYQKFVKEVEEKEKKEKEALGVVA